MALEKRGEAITPPLFIVTLRGATLDATPALAAELDAAAALGATIRIR